MSQIKCYLPFFTPGCCLLGLTLERLCSSLDASLPGAPRWALSAGDGDEGREGRLWMMPLFAGIT